jgi:NAD kinase
MYEKLVIVTRKTRLQELIERFNTRSQAKFYIEQAGGGFGDYEREDDAYSKALDILRHDLDFGLSQQVVDRSLVPTFEFRTEDLILTLGQDGLVANAAKYVGSQPIIVVNPEPTRFDGILLPFQVNAAKAAVTEVVEGKAAIRKITLGEVELNDGQRLLAFNDFFIGARSHISALYRIQHKEQRKYNPPAGCWFQLEQVPPVGCHLYLTWPQKSPSSVEALRDPPSGCHGKIHGCSIWFVSHSPAVIPRPGWLLAC